MTDRLQILREIDKLDKIGPAGVRAMLTGGMKDASGAFNKGVGIHPFQADFLVACITANGSDPLRRISELTSRFDMMVTLEDLVLDEKTGRTAWDALLKLPRNEDETWSNGGRPANIGWALDDLVKLSRMEGRKDG